MGCAALTGWALGRRGERQGGGTGRPDGAEPGGLQPGAPGGL